MHLADNDVRAIGTGFVVDAFTLQTAAHCIEGAKELSIRGVAAHSWEGARLFQSANGSADLGLIRFPNPVFSDTPPLTSGTPLLLQEIMTLGYPDVAGFQPALAAERALISSRLTASQGRIASTPFEIFAKTDLLLITARVRGGFSGGPVLNDQGDYVGLISRDAMSQVGDATDRAIHRYDDLGYGTAIPSPLVETFIKGVSDGDTSVARTLEGKTAFNEFIE